MAPQDATVNAGAVPTFQDIIMNLQHYWAEQGCVILQPYDGAVGAGTNHTATTLRSLGPDTWRTAYVQGCRRPTDGPDLEQLSFPVTSRWFELRSVKLSGDRPTVRA